MKGKGPAAELLGKRGMEARVTPGHGLIGGEALYDANRAAPWRSDGVEVVRTEVTSKGRRRRVGWAKRERGPEEKKAEWCPQA